MQGHIAEKNGRYYPVISIKDPGSGKWKRKWLAGHKTKREAQKARAEAVSQANKGWLTLPSRQTVAELFRNYFDNTGANRVRRVTLQSYKSMIENHLIPGFGAKQACALTPDDLNLMMSQMLKEGKSNTTVRYVLRIIHRVLDDAVKKGKLVRNVADLADPPPPQPYEANTWNEAQLDIFLSAVSTSKYANFFALLVTTALTGGRRGEALGIQWKNVNLNKDEPTLDIHRTVYKLDNGEWQIMPTKNKKFRTLDMPMYLMKLFLRLREQQEANAEWAGRRLTGEDFIFIRPEGTLPDPRYVTKVFLRIVKQAGLPRIRLHDLRHTCATLLRKHGRSIEEISKALGHASEVVTATIYNHWKGDSRAVADTIDSILEKAEEKRGIKEHSLEKC